MKILYSLLIFTLSISNFSLIAQSEKDENIESQLQILFKDTVRDFVFDSLTNNLGNIDPNMNQINIIKHFKYIGKDTLYIKKAWTQDPHFICEYPRDKIIPGVVYSYKICFWHKGRRGKMNKTMGFFISDDTLIRLQFIGIYCPVNEE